MIRFTWNHLNNQITTQAIAKLYHAKGLTTDTSYIVGKLCDRLDRERKKISEAIISLHKEYKVWDEEKKRPIMGEAGSLAFESKEKEDEHDAKFEKLMETEVRLSQFQPIHINKLGNQVGLTPIEVGFLSPFLGGLPEIDEEDDSDIVDAEAV